ncbi:MAG: response regulator, partial [Lachnospiraceae bacterium]|nr:response regulator [Lachnospiraceae bacterium]
MVQNPLTGDVEGILYSEQIDERVLKDNIITQVINNDYDYIIIMDLQNNTAKAFTNDGLYRPIQTDDAAGYVEHYIRRSYVGDDLEEFVAKNKWDHVQKILEKQDKYELYFYVNERGKGTRYKKGTYSYPNGDHRYIVFSRSDNNEAIEDQKRVNMRLKQALEESARATEAKTDIFARMSHDLRTPMNAIVGMASLGADEAVDEECKHYFEKINTSGNYLLGLINDILDMNRLESDKVVLNEEVVDSALFLQDALTIMQPLIDQRQIKFALDCAERKVDYVYCDVVRTRQIYINFLSNAVKFSPPGSVVQWVCRDLEVRDGRIYYEMKFVDQGCGMSQEFLKHVFEPFEQEQNPYSSENSSTGLGLAITKNLVHLMGGDVSVESELGKGSTFTLHLNHRIAKEADLTGKPLHKDYASLQGKHVLVAEDHPLNLEIEEKLLIKQGMEVTQAKDGEKAVAIFRQSPPYTFDAILMDVRMPVMNGLEAARAIRALDRADAKTVPIIAATANAFDEDRNASKEAGMNAHLSKPIVPGELYQTLQNLMKQKD